METAMNYLPLDVVPARFAHARYSSRMIDRFLNWGDDEKPKSGKIKGRCQPPLSGKKSNFVGCKIRNMRSRLVFLLSGIFTPLR